MKANEAHRKTKARKSLLVRPPISTVCPLVGPFDGLDGLGYRNHNKGRQSGQQQQQQQQQEQQQHQQQPVIDITVVISLSSLVMHAFSCMPSRLWQNVKREPYSIGRCFFQWFIHIVRGLHP